MSQIHPEPDPAAQERNPGKHLQRLLEAELIRAAGLVDLIDHEIYAAGSEVSGNVGAHLRHNLDFVACFLGGLETGTIDYTSRSRDKRVETSRAAAVEKIEELALALSSLDCPELEDKVGVRSETDPTLILGSTVGRELEFLHSHTVHHYAMIAEKLRNLGLDISPEFGVAPSTLDHWRQNAVRSSG